MSFYPGIDPLTPAGMTTEQFTVENEFTWGNVNSQQRRSITIASSALDAGSVPTNTLRRGLTLGKVTATGKFKQYNPAATDGTQYAVGFLMVSVALYDVASGAAVDKNAQILLAGNVKLASVYGLDEQARRQLGARFLFDDLRVYEYPRDIVAKTADYTLVAADSGLHYTTTGASASVNFTLPAPTKGFRARFTNTVNQTMTITAPSGLLVTFNNAAATSVSFATAGNKIGANVEIVTNEDGSKYMTIFSGANTVTVA